MSTDETPQQRRERGLQRMAEVYGFDFADGPGAFFGYTADHLFAEIWDREALTDRDRRLLLIGMLAGQGAHDVNEIQIDAAFRLGELDAEQLRELPVFLAHYAGWPAGARTNTTVEGVIGRQGDQG